MAMWVLTAARIFRLLISIRLRPNEFFGFLSGSSPYFDAQILQDETWITESDYLTDAFTREATSFITRHAAERFFLYLAYNAPHAPWKATPEYLARVAYIPDPDRRV